MGDPRLSKERVILVVEDDVLIRLDIAEFLTAHGWTVLEAATLDQARALCASDGQIDVLFTDIQLNGSPGGWDVAESFRSARPGIPVVYASGHIGDRTRSVPGSVFIDKPFSSQQVLKTCRELVAARF